MLSKAKENNNNLKQIFKVKELELNPSATKYKLKLCATVYRIILAKCNMINAEYK